ncbi:uncharacterized protein GGS22DRAFT_58092 [Annulohypoxylon maeteangense]|uniref:uncharacterized protein n=1 Tax=Annulohypoxylon maeteangense TaxID=1927788 RepID=UPI00200811C1|nr:uncharacterized protein GGS22DRAFT_58092 [Annulohypoxylon maeteangense]KAI0881440.1 hypothetical protein GGS22DRAFT_58092 [Annulohypoxylon maeteangense]
MTELVPEQPQMADASHDYNHDHDHDQDLDLDPPPFAPIFTLVNNTSTRTTHHPHVRYIFSDDDPDILTQALAELDTGADESSSDPTLRRSRAMILDLAPDSKGGYNVAWASSLSASWAVLDTQLDHIPPPSSDGSNDGNDGGDNSARVDRLMLRIDGIETSALGSEGGTSGDASRQGSGIASGGGSGHHDREKGETEDYTNIVDKFERRMTTLRKIVEAGEERRRIIAAAYTTEPMQEAIEGNYPAY